jgi:hypothetical protein
MSRLAILVVLLFSLNAFSQVGTRGGGSDCGLDFAHLGSLIAEQLKRSDYFSSILDLDRFSSVVRGAKVIVSKRTLSDGAGNVFDAQNEPSTQTIYVSEMWCQNRRTDPKVELVFHEYLGLYDSKIDDSYQLSRDLFTQTGLSTRLFINLMISGGRDSEVLILGPIARADVSSLTYFLGRDSKTLCLPRGALTDLYELNCHGVSSTLSLLIGVVKGQRFCGEIEDLEITGRTDYKISSYEQCKVLSSYLGNTASRRHLRIYLGLLVGEVLRFETTPDW